MTCAAADAFGHLALKEYRPAGESRASWHRRLLSRGGASTGGASRSPETTPLQDSASEKDCFSSLSTFPRLSSG